MVSSYESCGADSSVLAAGSCLACDATAGRVEPPGGTILDEGGWVLEHALSPVPLRGWLILKPRRHVEHLAELEPAEAAALGPLIARISAAMSSALAPERIYVTSFGEVVRHVHLYFVPRYAGMPPIGPGVLVQMGSGDSPWASDDAAAAEAAARVRAALGGDR
jgi:diadenosine tetraphosphate (Ap4A) HIT family hydrolase